MITSIVTQHYNHLGMTVIMMGHIFGKIRTIILSFLLTWSSNGAVYVFLEKLIHFIATILLQNLTTPIDLTVDFSPISIEIFW